MTKTIKILTVIGAFILMSSFTDENNNVFIGTYGVCASDPSQIKLVINADHTFSFQDFSVRDNNNVIKGNWAVKGKKLVLNDNNSDEKFHDVWTFAENGQVAKSRKGFTFYRLAKIEV